MKEVYCCGKMRKIEGMKKEEMIKVEINIDEIAKKIKRSSNNK